MKLFFIFTAVLLQSLTSCSASGAMSQDARTAHVQVIAPDMPHSVEFAGETVVFDRYDLRERIDRELISFCYMHSTTLLVMKRANRYLPEVEKILKEEGIPDDFKYLMIIESNANPLSLSGAGAAGLWQFMESTARECGLEVTSSVDERYHTEKATRAACRYIRAAYNNTGSWFAAAASYNAGQGRIVTQLQKQYTDNALDLYLTSETSRYVFRIMAAKIILNDPAAYGFVVRDDQLYPPFEYSVVTVNTAIADLPAWAKEHGVTYKQLRDANPWLRKHELINKSGKRYEIRILSDESIYPDYGNIRCHLPCCR
ncbi:MAG: lytic transglycosylase domain-containing protein [Candidatus Aphodosoma sp.]